MLETEIRENKLKDIELWKNKSILSEMLNKQETAFHAVKSELKSIEFAVSLAVKRLKKMTLNLSMLVQALQEG